jgi:hypothetical protein
MNKSQKELLEESYRNYLSKNTFLPDNKWLKETTEGEYDLLSYEEFIDKCKIDPTFSERFGLKIEERKLNRSGGWERYELLIKIISEKDLSEKYKEDKRSLWIGFRKFKLDDALYFCDLENIPTKLITITYKDEKIEVYE